MSRSLRADNNIMRNSIIAALRKLGWAWAVAFWAAFAVFATAVAMDQNVDPKPLLGLLAGTGMLLGFGLWKPRLIGTAIVLAVVTPFAGLIGAIYAANTGDFVSLAEVNLRMGVFMVLLAVLAHRLPGRPWVRLLCAFVVLCGPGLYLSQFVAEVGINGAYLASFGGLFVPSIPFHLMRRRGPKGATV